MESAVKNASNTLNIHKTDHGAGSPSDLNETALNDVGGAQFAPQVSGHGEEREQLRQVAFQSANHAAVSSSPTCAKIAERSFGLGTGVLPSCRGICLSLISLQK
jgi:hypothetical protein